MWCMLTAAAGAERSAACIPSSACQFSFAFPLEGLEKVRAVSGGYGLHGMLQATDSELASLDQNKSDMRVTLLSLGAWRVSDENHSHVQCLRELSMSVLADSLARHRC